jgi:hypothetical protein
VRDFQLVCCATALLLAGGCGEALPEHAALPAPPPIAQAGSAIELAAVSLEEPPICEDPGAPQLEATALEAIAPAATPASRSTQAAARPRIETTAPPAEAHVPLETLLRTPPVAAAPPLHLPLPDGEPAAVAPPPGVLDGWKDRVRVERRTEATGHAGPKQGSVSQTDAGLRVPVDDAVSLEGGVRVDSREDPEAEAPVRQSMPRVGIEVRF